MHIGYWLLIERWCRDMFLDKVVSVQRLTPTSGDSDKESYVTVSGLEAVKMNIQPASAELTAITNGAYGQVFKAFTGISNIKVGDRVTISGSSKLFIVNGVQDHQYGPLPHLELVLFEGDN